MSYQLGGNASPAGLTGAVAASRYVGGTTSGAPTTGTFAVGDYVISQDGFLYICVTAGTPGTWTVDRSVFNSGTTGSEFSNVGELTPTYYSVSNTVLGWTLPPYASSSSACSPASGATWCVRTPIFKSGTIGKLVWTTGAAMATPTAPAQRTVAAGSNGQNINALTATTLNLDLAPTGFINGTAYAVITKADLSSRWIVKYTATAASTLTGTSVAAGVSFVVSTGDLVDQLNNIIFVYTDAGVLIGGTPDMSGAARWQTAQTTDTQAVTLINSNATGGGSLAVTAGTFIRIGVISVATTPVNFKGVAVGIVTSQGLTAATAPSGRIAAATQGGLPDSITSSSLNLNTNTNALGIPAFLVTT